MPIDRRIVFCLKLWVKELKQKKGWERNHSYVWVITTIENEILNGEYCEDEEYIKAQGIWVK